MSPNILITLKITFPQYSVLFLRPFMLVCRQLNYPRFGSVAQNFWSEGLRHHCTPHRPIYHILYVNIIHILYLHIHICIYIYREIKDSRRRWRGGNSLIPLFYLHLLHRHLDINQAIPPENSSLYIASNLTQNSKLWF